MNKRQRKKAEKRHVEQFDVALNKISAGRFEDLTKAERVLVEHTVIYKFAYIADQVGEIVRKAFLALPRLMDQIEKAMEDPEKRKEITEKVGPRAVDKFLDDKKKIAEGIKNLKGRM